MKKLIATTATFATGLYWALPVFAANITGDVNLCAGDKASILCNLTLGKVVSAGVQAILVIALVLAFIFLVIGGIKWILSGGDKGGTEAAKGTITAALIGLIIVFLAWAFLNLVGNFFGVGGVDQTLNIQGIQK